MPLVGGFRSGATSNRPAAPGPQPEQQRLMLEQVPVPEQAMELGLLWLALVPAP